MGPVDIRNADDGLRLVVCGQGKAGLLTSHPDLRTTEGWIGIAIWDRGFRVTPVARPHQVWQRSNAFRSMPPDETSAVLKMDGHKVGPCQF